MLLAIFIVLLLVLLFFSINRLLQTDPEKLNPYVADNLWILLSVGFIGPVLEEIYFRKIIQKGLNQTDQPFISIAITSILFMFVHSWDQYLFAILMGFFFGITYVIFNYNILAPIVLHMVANNFSSFLQYLYFKNDDLNFSLIAIISCVLLLPITCIYFKNAGYSKKIFNRSGSLFRFINLRKSSN